MQLSAGSNVQAIDPLLPRPWVRDGGVDQELASPTPTCFVPHLTPSPTEKVEGVQFFGGT